LSEFHSGFSMSGFDLSGHETAWWLGTLLESQIND